MRMLLWCCRLFIFLFLLAFALKNTELVEAYFFFDISWQAPFIVVALAFFAIGVVFGLLGLLGTVFRLKREIKRLRKGVEALAVETTKNI